MLNSYFWNPYRPPAGVLLPFLHIISDSAPLHVRHLYAIPTIAKFKSDLDFLCQQYRSLQVSDLQQLSINHDYRRQAQNFILSFDDGMREVYDVIAPMLLQYGIPALFFINSGTVDNKRLMWRHKLSLIIDRCNRDPKRVPPQLSIRPGERLDTKLKRLRFADEQTIDEIARFYEVDFDEYLRRARPYLTTEQVLELFNRGFAIGAHTHSHPFLNELALEDQKKQISGSVEFIRALGLPCRYFSFPFHDEGVPASIFSYMTCLDLRLSLGTSEARVDSIPFSFQRFRLDGTHAKATVSHILRQLSAKSLLRRLSGTEIIWRN